MSISAHGATIDVAATAHDAEVVITRSLLARSLGAAPQVRVAVSTITEVETVSPTATGFGSLILHRAGEPDVSVRFAPGTDPASAAALVDAARRGELPSSGALPGSLPGAPVPKLDFVALDVETANDSWGSICQVGAVRFRDGQETESASWLCTPPGELDFFLDVNISIHGITAADVTDAPAFADILPEIVAFVGEDVLVAHNAQFDSTALREAARAAGAPVPEFPVACSLALARDASRAGRIDVANHKLPTVNKAVGGPEFKHHDATEDARAAGLIITGLARAFGFAGPIRELFAAREFVLGHVGPGEVMPVLRRHTAPTPTSTARTAAASPRGGAAGDSVPAQAGLWDTDPAAVDGAAAPEPTEPAATQAGQPERRRGPVPWAAVATPDTVPEPSPDADPTGPLFGQNVTLTGDFEPFDKGTLWQGIAAHGGQVGKSVTRKTTILVLGTWATKTSKEKRAEELIAKGQEIALWPQDRLLAALGLDSEPPF